MKKAYIFLADGFEEIEALATVDILKRAGIHTTTVSINPTLTVNGAHGVPVITDTLVTEVFPEPSHWLILPGGMPGATNLAACEPLTTMLTAHHAQGSHIAAICASPAVVLSPLGILADKEATCYPGFESSMKCAKVGCTPVVVDKNIITANGPGNTFAFALTIVASAVNEAKAREVAEGMLIYTPQQDYNF